MPAFQDIFEQPSAGKKGQWAASSEPRSTLSRIVDANVDCGLAVCNGATPGSTCKVPTTAAEVRKCLGVLLDPEFLNEIGAAADYLAGQQATIAEKGILWVIPEVNVAVDDDVFVRHTSDGGSFTVRGTFRSDNDTPVAGIVITPTASGLVAAQGAYIARLRDKAGNDETFIATGDGTLTVNELATNLRNLIDASPNFNAVDNTGSLTITAQAGGMVEVLQLGEHLVVTTPARAERLRGAKFVTAATAGLPAKVKLQLRQD